MKKTTKGHGGKREGAGRKESFSPSQLVSVRISKGLLNTIDREPMSRSKVIQNALFMWNEASQSEKDKILNAKSFLLF